MLFAQTANNTKSFIEKIEENPQKLEIKPVVHTETAKNPWSLSFPSTKRKSLAEIEKIQENPLKSLSFLKNPQEDLLDIKPKLFLESLENEKPEEIEAFFEKDTENASKNSAFL